MLKKNKIFFKKNNCLDPPLSYILLYIFLALISLVFNRTKQLYFFPKEIR